MTQVIVFLENGKPSGFKITGHSTDNCEDNEGKLVCAAVSSAAYMTANTLTEIIGDKADIKVSDAEMEIMADNKDRCADLLSGFVFHVKELAKEYPKRIKLIMWRNNND